MDIAKYIGTANVSSQTAFGLTYITGFVGGVTILSFTDVPQGKIYATVPNNLILAYANVGGAVGSAFDLTQLDLWELLIKLFLSVLLMILLLSLGYSY